MIMDLQIDFFRTFIALAEAKNFTKPEKSHQKLSTVFPRNQINERM